MTAALCQGVEGVMPCVPAGLGPFGRHCSVHDQWASVHPTLSVCYPSRLTPPPPSLSPPPQVAALQTEAVLDVMTDEWVIHTPDEGAIKW